MGERNVEFMETKPLTRKRTHMHSGRRALWVGPPCKRQRASEVSPSGEGSSGMTKNRNSPPSPRGKERDDGHYELKDEQLVMGFENPKEAKTSYSSHDGKWQSGPHCELKEDDMAMDMKVPPVPLNLARVVVVPSKQPQSTYVTPKAKGEDMRQYTPSTREDLASRGSPHLSLKVVEDCSLEDETFEESRGEESFKPLKNKDRGNFKTWKTFKTSDVRKAKPHWQSDLIRDMHSENARKLGNIEGAKLGNGDYLVDGLQESARKVMCDIEGVKLGNSGYVVDGRQELNMSKGFPFNDSQDILKVKERIDPKWLLIKSSTTKLSKFSSNKFSLPKRQIKLLDASEMASSTLGVRGNLIMAKAPSPTFDQGRKMRLSMSPKERAKGVAFGKVDIMERNVSDSNLKQEKSIPVKCGQDRAARIGVTKLLKLFRRICHQFEGGRKELEARNIIVSAHKEYLVNGLNSIYGEVPGIEVGDRFEYRVEMELVGLHHQLRRGIDVISTRNSKWYIGGKLVCVAASIVVAGGYVDNCDKGDIIIYTGEGGNNHSHDKGLAQDQTLTAGNMALRHSKILGLSVRVVRKVCPKGSSRPYYRYDGLYDVVDLMKERSGGDITREVQESSNSRPLVYKFALVRKSSRPTYKNVEDNLWDYVKS